MNTILQGTYDIHRSYEENYQEGPFLPGPPVPCRNIATQQTFLGFKVNSLLGVPAGPLLNSRWILAYAALGYDLLVYKTVRTVAVPSHQNPNCLFLHVNDLLSEDDFGKPLVASMEAPPASDTVSITNSFGMPSRTPEIWQADVERAKQGLRHIENGGGQVLIVSVVGTPSQGDLAADYARAASLAVEAGADMVEINLSCPNVDAGSGAIYADPQFSSKVTRAVKAAIGAVPLIIKMGYLADPRMLAEVVRANTPYIQAVSGINTLSFSVVNEKGEPALPGRLRSGVCGAAIRKCAQEQAARIVQLKQHEKYDFAIIGVGGIMIPEHIREYLNLGVDAVMSATGAMWDPRLAYRYWKEGA